MFKAHRRLYYSTLGLRVTKKKKMSWMPSDASASRACRAKREHFETFQGRLHESQGQNLALTVLYVPYSLRSGTPC